MTTQRLYSSDSNQTWFRPSDLIKLQKCERKWSKCPTGAPENPLLFILKVFFLLSLPVSSVGPLFFQMQVFQSDGDPGGLHHHRGRGGL